MGKVRPVRSFYAARGHLQKCELLSCIKPKTSFLSSTLNVSVKKDMSGREDLFLHQFSVVILEKLIYNRIYSYLDKADLLSRHQYGFRQNSSTVHTLCTIYDLLIKNADDGLYSCCIFLDLTKAFDTVDHAILLNKLDHFFGIRGLPLQLLENYLTNRKQYTKLSHYKSKLAKLTHGVP